MRKALSEAKISVQEMADYLDVSRNTVSTWINNRITPSKQTLRLWEIRTGVPLTWLETGQAPLPVPDGYAVRDSNPEPASYEHALARVYSPVASAIARQLGVTRRRWELMS